MPETPKAIQRFPRGTVIPPASKSLCHRAVICAALASQNSTKESRVLNLDRSDDIDATIAGMSALYGVETRFSAIKKELSIAQANVGAENKRSAASVIDCNESGSTLRFLLPIAALAAKETVFTGRGRLLQRPLGIYADIFARAGVKFVQSGQEARVRGPLKAGVYFMPGNVSSQFISGLLFALPLAQGDSEIHLTTPLESRQYVDLTVDVMRHFGIEIREEPLCYYVRGNQRYCSADYTVEADYSQSAFFLAAAALGQPVHVAGLQKQSRQGDRAILNVIQDMGAFVSWQDDTVCVTADKLTAVTIDAREIPDLVPPIAALCCFCDGTSHIINAGRLRLKESDRLHALAAELTKLGANITEHADALEITGAPTLRGGIVDAWGDHRIAMAMATASIRCQTPVILSGWNSVAKSYPGFWHDFETGAKENIL